MRFGFLQPKIDSVIKPYFKGFDFAEPYGEPALLPPNSLAWEVLKNPIIAFIGGVSSVIMQLSEPRIRTGVWEHSGFEKNVVGRTKRTARSGMANVYGPASEAVKVIERINAVHEDVHGITKCGKPYSAKDPELLRWVEETVAYGMNAAYSDYIRQLSTKDLERDYPIRKQVSALYGVEHLSETEAEREAYFTSMLPSLEANDNIKKFITIMRSADFLPAPLKPIQHIFVNAAVSNVPENIRQIIGLDDSYGLKAWQKPIVKLASIFGDNAMSDAYPCVIASKRLGLPDDYLFSNTKPTFLENGPGS